MKRPNYGKYAKRKKYLASSKWKNKRKKKLKIISSCEHCNDSERLEIHHKHYRSVGNEDMDDLMVLCHDCHKKEHDRLRRLR